VIKGVMEYCILRHVGEKERKEKERKEKRKANLYSRHG
jgi:hypothetical protein